MQFTIDIYLQKHNVCVPVYIFKMARYTAVNFHRMAGLFTLTMIKAGTCSYSTLMEVFPDACDTARTTIMLHFPNLVFQDQRWRCVATGETRSATPSNPNERKRGGGAMSMWNLVVGH
jgi:hypothetical protein